MPGEKNVKPDAWLLFDRIVTDAAQDRAGSPWVVRNGAAHYQPDYSTLTALLGVPQLLDSQSNSGIPALALDVWVASEFRRAGFDRDALWPRPEVPRVLPAAISRLLDGLNKKDAQALRKLLATGKTLNGTVSANARIMGKNYIKQVDVGMSDWDTGPELLVSTKRMDFSFARNAPNRVEESYGDAKNLRSRHPRAALGFVFLLRSTALIEAPDVAAWIIDLLGKLGREEDAYDSVMLLIPSYDTSIPIADIDEAPVDDLVEAGLLPVPDDDGVPSNALGTADELMKQLATQPEVSLLPSEVPRPLSPEVFFESMTRRVLDNSPITRHVDARRLLANADA